MSERMSFKQGVATAGLVAVLGIGMGILPLCCENTSSNKNPTTTIPIRDYLPRSNIARCSPTTTQVKPQKRVVLIRRNKSDKGIEGALYYQGEKLADTLELPYKNNQANISSIPEGEYILSPRTSLKFRDHYKIEGTGERTDILIHGGNSTKDTAGCILAGSTNGRYSLKESRKTMERLNKTLGRENYLLTIQNGAN